MSSIAARTYLTPEEYIAAERKETLKSEYLSGEIVAMSGASDTHNLITMNTSTALYNQLADRGGRVYASDMRVGISTGVSYFYPDIAVTCDKPRFEDDVFDTLINPQVIIEVFSDSTAGYDRGEKFIRYRQLESLQEYILISQDQVQVDHYLRQGERWILSEFSALEDVLPLASIKAELPLHQIYGHSGVKPNALALGYKSAKGVFRKINLTNRLKMLYNESITVADIISVTAPFRVTAGTPVACLPTH